MVEHGSLWRSQALDAEAWAAILRQAEEMAAEKFDVGSKDFVEMSRYGGIYIFNRSAHSAGPN